jgi:hypothetical protein
MKHYSPSRETAPGEHPQQPVRSLEEVRLERCAQSAGQWTNGSVDRQTTLHFPRKWLAHQI